MTVFPCKRPITAEAPASHPFLTTFFLTFPLACNPRPSAQRPTHKPCCSARPLHQETLCRPAYRYTHIARSTHTLACTAPAFQQSTSPSATPLVQPGVRLSGRLVLRRPLASNGTSITASFYSPQNDSRPHPCARPLPKSGCFHPWSLPDAPAFILVFIRHLHAITAN